MSHRPRQKLLPFLDRTQRVERAAKWAIFGVTVAMLAVLLGGVPSGRYFVAVVLDSGQRTLNRWAGNGADRAEIEAIWHRSRLRDVSQTESVLATYYRNADPAMQRLFREAGMAPGVAVVRWGNYDRTLFVSNQVYAPDDLRSYRLRPDVRSIWLRQITLRDGPFGLFLVPDTEKVRKAAHAVGGIVVEESLQTTNAWGLRGPLPDLKAPVRVLVLGDSFMQGTFVGDADTPPEQLKLALGRLIKVPVSVLNTGHLGYSPEQYFRTLQEYGDRFRPTFVVVSVCPNDFGDFFEVLGGGGSGWEESVYWLEEIRRWCLAHAVPWLVVAVPTEDQIRVRRDGGYPGRVASTLAGFAANVLNPLDDFVNEHLRLMRDATRAGHRPPNSPLYNGLIGDGHFSPQGSALWAEVVARRMVLMMPEPNSQP